MKMVKKILLGTLALAAVLALTSCGEKQDEEKAFDDKNFEFVHNGKNTTDGLYYRSFASTKTKHFSANATITLEDADTLTTFPSTDGTEVSAKAGIGFIFGLEEVTGNNDVKKYVYDENFQKVKKSDGSFKTEKVRFYDFGVASVRWNASTNKAQWYVSWCKNVPDSVFNYNGNGDFKDDSLKSMPENAGVTIPEAKEYQIKKGVGTNPWADVSGLSLSEDGSFKALIQTFANEGENAGSYTVKLCDPETPDTAIETAEISASETGFTGKQQKLIGRYLTVYWKQSVKGSIEYSDISGNVIPADYDVVIE